MDTTSLLYGESLLNDDNLEAFTLIWLDNEVDSLTNQGTQKKLRSSINYLKKFENGNECQQYIKQKSKDDRLVLIVTGRLGREIVPNIHQLRQVSSIYVFCMDKKANEQWACKYPKIKSVIVDSSELISTIETNQKVLIKIEEPFSYNVFIKNPNGDSSKIKANYEFIYFQLFLHCLIKMKSNENDIKELINLLEKEYDDNDEQLTLIKKLENEYTSDDILTWYTSNSFLTKILNKVLQIENLHRIFLFHSYISDVYFQLKQSQLTNQSEVYRSQLLTKDELDSLKDNLGQLISINSFLLTNTDRKKVLEDLENYQTADELQRVLFEIDINPESVTIKPFAHIDTQNSSTDQTEVLLMAASIFSLEDINCNDDGIWIIKMSLCTDDEYNSLLKSSKIKQQNPDEQSNLRTLAKILWKMEKFDLANSYYNRFIDELPSNDPFLINIYDDLGTMALQKKSYESSVQWYKKSSELKKQNPSITDTDESTTFLDYFPNIGKDLYHPKCRDQDKCNQLDDEAHRRVFFHRLPCESGGQCLLIDDTEHSKNYQHPDFCHEHGFCEDMSEPHLNKYRHVPLCKDSLHCSLLLKHDSHHRTNYRHCKTNCKYGTYCYKFHHHEHLEEENHPFNVPCPYTPYMCHLYERFVDNPEQTSLCDLHCFRYSHLCPQGRQCTNLLNKEHIKSHIHVIRTECSDRETCQLLSDENHLNSYTHSSINDIRLLCGYEKLLCPEYSKSDHMKQYRHMNYRNHLGVSRCSNFNKIINFVQNQTDMINNIGTYLQTAGWDSTTLIVKDEIKNWIRALQPMHRCNKLIFESILVHGHVMSRDHMDSLKYVDPVAKAIKQHPNIKRIFDNIKSPRVQHACEEYITKLVEIQFRKANMIQTPASEQQLLQAKSQYELILIDFFKDQDMDIVRKLADEICDASVQLTSNKTGIGFGADQIFDTDKHVFGILGPNLGYYYGDIIILFRRELMYHPDTNFTIQAATTLRSGNAYRWRPWLRDPGTAETRVEHFHKTKLHCTIPGYENAAAHELIALTGLKTKSITDIDVDAIEQRWLHIDAHQVFETHLPKLIALDSIERVYMPQTIFDSLSDSAQQSAKTIFGDGLVLTSHAIDPNSKPAGLHQPLDPIRTAYQSFVMNDVCQIIEKKSTELPLFQGIHITLPASQFKEHILIPLTLSQSAQQYKLTENLSTDIIYIYWEAFYGDMMLTLTNKQLIDENINLNDFQCLTCYIAKWPSNNTIKNTKQNLSEYREGYSYIGNHHPIRHHFVIDDQRFKVGLNTFHRGCNIDDYIMYNLIIDKNTSQVTLSIVGSNFIYNHQIIQYTFNQKDLDLNNLEFIQITAGLQTVPIKNLIIQYQPIKQYHPAIDLDFIQKPLLKPIGKTKQEINLCPDSIHCLLQYAGTDEARQHNEQYKHFCRFSELCRNKAREPNFIHIRHAVSMCQDDKECTKLADPIHRAQYRHSNYPDYIVPCRFREKCRTKAADHRIKFSHGEPIPLPLLKENTEQN